MLISRLESPRSQEFLNEEMRELYDTVVQFSHFSVKEFLPFCGLKSSLNEGVLSHRIRLQKSLQAPQREVGERTPRGT